MNQYLAGLGHRRQYIRVGNGVSVRRRWEKRPPLDGQPDQPRGPGRLISGAHYHRGRIARAVRDGGLVFRCGTRTIFFVEFRPKGAGGCKGGEGVEEA